MARIRHFLSKSWAQNEKCHLQAILKCGFGLCEVGTRDSLDFFWVQVTESKEFKKKLRQRQGEARWRQDRGLDVFLGVSRTGNQKSAMIVGCTWAFSLLLFFFWSHLSVLSEEKSTAF